jgi:hypothetical protein
VVAGFESEFAHMSYRLLHSTGLSKGCSSQQAKLKLWKKIDPPRGIPPFEERRVGQPSLIPHAGCHHLSELLSNQKRLALAEDEWPTQAWFWLEWGCSHGPHILGTGGDSLAAVAGYAERG